MPSVALVATLFAAASVRADLIVSSFPGDDSAQIGLNSSNAEFKQANSAAVGFTTPAGIAYMLDSVTLRLQQTDVGTLFVDLFADVGGQPGGPALVSFVVPPIPSQPTNVVLTPASPFTLQPGTTYWIAAGISNGIAVSVVWLGSSPGGPITGVGSYVGATYGAGYPPTTPLVGTVPTFSVSGTPTTVPAPASGPLLLLGALALGGCAWGRKQIAARARQQS